MLLNGHPQAPLELRGINAQIRPEGSWIFHCLCSGAASVSAQPYELLGFDPSLPPSNPAVKGWNHGRRALVYKHKQEAPGGKSI